MTGTHERTVLLLLLDENTFGHLDVDADLAIYQLGDSDVGGYAGELVGRVLVEPLELGDEIDRLLNGDLRRLREVLIHAHRDVVGLRLGARPCEGHILADDQLDASTQRGFDRGLVHFAVPLRRVSVADLEQRAGDMHRNEEGRPGDELFVIEVAGMNPGRRTVDASSRGGRRNAHAPEKWF